MIEDRQIPNVDFRYWNYIDKTTKIRLMNGRVFGRFNILICTITFSDVRDNIFVIKKIRTFGMNVR